MLGLQGEHPSGFSVAYRAALVVLGPILRDGASNFLPSELEPQGKDHVQPMHLLMEQKQTVNETARIRVNKLE